MAKKAFTMGNKTYSKEGNVAGGVQWRCNYDCGSYTQDAFTFIPKQNPTRAEIVEAFENLENK
jgi:hypothetical protein